MTVNLRSVHFWIEGITATHFLHVGGKSVIIGTQFAHGIANFLLENWALGGWSARQADWMLKTPIELCGCHHIHDFAGTAIFKM
jgi:hypothetical protein